MNKIFSKIAKKGVPLVLTLVMGTAMFTACGTEKTPEEPVNPNPPIVTPIDPDKPVDPGKPVEPSKPTWTTEAYDEFVANMVVKDNYLYTVTQNGKTDSYDIDGGVVRYHEEGDRRGVYWYTENDIGYQIKYSENDSKYHKTKAEKVDADSIVLDSLKGATLSAYDEITKKYTVSLGGAEYQMSIASNALEFVNSSKTFVVSEVGQNSFELPADRFIIDDTNKESVDPEKPDPENPDKPVVTEDKIFVVDSLGNRVYNNQLLAATVLEALNTDIGGKKLCADAAMAIDSVDSVKYISVADGNIEFGIVANNIFGQKSFCIFNLSENNISSENTGAELKSTLLAGGKITGKAKDSIQHYTDENNSTFAENTKTVASNVINRLAKDGVQQELGKSDVAATELQDAKVLFAYTVKSDSDGVGYGIGDVQFLGVKCVVETTSGECKFIDTTVVTRHFSSQTPFDVMVAGNNTNFIVNERAKDKTVEKSLYKSVKTQTKAAQMPALVQGKGKDL